MTSPLVDQTPRQDSEDEVPIPAALAPFLSSSLIERVRSYRQQWHARLESLVPMPALAEHNDAFRYAVHANRLEGAVAAARRGDDARLNELRDTSNAEAFARAALQTATGMSLAVRLWRPPGKSPSEPYGEMPATPLTDMAEDVPDHLRDLLRCAVDLCAAVGFGRLLREACGAVVMLHERSISDTTQSYTLSDLPATVHADYHLEPPLFGVELVHESIHNWVNDVLAATGVRFSQEPLYHSPWKDTVRPAAGFFHSIMAFVGVVTYCQAVEDRCATSEQASYVRTQRERQLWRLQPLASDVTRLVNAELGDHPEVAGLLVDAYAIAH